MWHRVIFIAISLTGCVFSLQFSTKLTSKARSPNQSLTRLQDKGKHDAEQWALFKQNTAGFWKGLQAGYDPQDDEVEDYMYTEVTVEGEEELTQQNGFVVGEIRADCEVCFDSERLRTKDAGVFSQGAMGNRKCCGNVDVRGPAPTMRGMSVETGFRHGDGRVRILLSYSPIDFDENEVPLAMGLMDVVITRERLNRRPLKLDDEEGGWDVLWRVTKEEDFDKLAQSDQVLSVEMQQYMPDDESRTIPSPAQALNSLEVKSDQQQHHHHHDSEGDLCSSSSDQEEDQFVYRRVFPGGVLVESEAIVYPGVPTRIRLGHAPSPDEALVYSADLTFSALERPPVDEMANSEMMRLRPPRLLDLSVGKREIASKF